MCRLQWCYPPAADPVTEMKITYTAVDGKTFENEAECLAHEEFLAKRPELVRDAILDGMRAQSSSEYYDGDRSKLDRLIAIVERFADAVGFDEVEDMSDDMRLVLYACDDAFGMLETEGHLQEMRERVESRLVIVCTPNS